MAIETEQHASDQSITCANCATQIQYSDWLKREDYETYSTVLVPFVLKAGYFMKF